MSCPTEKEMKAKAREKAKRAKMALEDKYLDDTLEIIKQMAHDAALDRKN